jgi:hypothetical protein
MGILGVDASKDSFPNHRLNFNDEWLTILTIRHLACTAQLLVELFSPAQP